MKKEQNRRRTFLGKLGLSLLSIPVITRSSELHHTDDSKETQFMLTPDGKLVEIPKNIYRNATSRSDVRKRKKLWMWLTNSKNQIK